MNSELRLIILVLTEGGDVAGGWLSLDELLEAFIEEGLDPSAIAFYFTVERYHKLSLLVVSQNI